MSKHTQGEWTADFKNREVLGPDNEEVCTANFQVESPDELIEIAANLRLIAAAPTMAESIQKFYESIDSTNIFNPTQLKAWGEMIDALELAVGPGPEEVEVCDGCDEPTRQAGTPGDMLSHCDNCGCVEGNTHRAVRNG